MTKMIESFRELLIGRYMDILAITGDRNLEELDKQVKVLSVLSGLGEEEILDLPLPEYKSMVARMRFLEKAPEDVHSTVAKSYAIGGFELVPVTDFRKMTAAQYIDFQTFTADGVEKRYVEILSCFMVPKGKSYCKDYDVTDVHNAIRENLTVTDTLSLYAFFFGSWRESMRDSSTFLREVLQRLSPEEMRKVTEELRALQTPSPSAGDGRQTSTV